MAPKPFPFPISVGVDICRIRRIADLIRQETIRNRWARRIFTRLEWPALCRRFQRATYQAEDSKSLRKIEKQGATVEESSAENIWTLPKLTKHPDLFDDQQGYLTLIQDERSKIGVLVRHLAGRWAAKEAVIKAHRHRQLHMHDVSIVRLPHQVAKSGKAVALIDPVAGRVEMNERVAALRGLRGFGLQSQELRKVSMIAQDEYSDTTQENMKQTIHFIRRRRVDEADRQIAEINISHDGEYAVATCMALDSPNLHPEGRVIVDQGFGPPVHEPEWGDEGWFDRDDLSGGWKSKSHYDSSREPDNPMDTDAYRRAFKKTLEDADKQDHWRIPPLP